MKPDLGSIRRWLGLGLFSIVFIAIIWVVNLLPAPTSAQVSGGGGGGGGGGGTTGTLTITLPAKSLLMPGSIRIGSYTFIFLYFGGNGTGTWSGSGPYPNTVTCHTDGGVSAPCSSNDPTLGFTLGFSGFAKGGGTLALDNQKYGNLISRIDNALSAKAFAPPFPCFAVCVGRLYPFRLTFASPLPQSTVNSYVAYVRSTGNTLADTYLGDNQCVRNGSGTNLCIRENTKFDSTERGTTGPEYTIQAIPLGTLGSVNIQGNVAAPGLIDGFSFSNIANSIAVGGTIGTVGNASKTLTNYINQNSTKFSWTNVQPQLTALFGKRTKGTLYANPTYVSPNWYLNSSTGDPANSAQNSFSTPPEGKLWNAPSFLTFTGDIHFSGSGTIAVNGPLLFSGNVTCDPGTRLGIIANGQITFNGNIINCGAYTSLGGDVNFNFNVTSGNPTATGIFVAKNSIVLPSLGPGTSYNINYDNLFASNPTVLFAQLLQLVFSTSP